MKICIARIEDAEELLAIYKPYVEKTAISFETSVPSIEIFQSRIENTLKRYPYLIAKENDEIVGYAYTSAFHERKAYQWSAEVSIYVKETKQKMGIGKKLYEAIEFISKAQHILNLNACIAYPQIDDEHLTKNSVQFHEHMGYHMVGEFHNSGYKFQTWYNMVWMEKMLGEHDSHPLPILSFCELDQKLLSQFD